MVQTSANYAAPHVVHCARCGYAMSVAPEHTRIAVGCPHCGQVIEPWCQGEPGRPALPVMVDWSGGEGRLVSSRHKVVAGILGIVLGAFGVHRFYLGFIGIGIIQLLLFWTGISAVWGLAEGILCLFGEMHDVDGLPLRG